MLEGKGSDEQTTSPPQTQWGDMREEKRHESGGYRGKERS